jgi:outer membrane protein assembly factor BamE (lipoprotein component of BamABCDE complex)
MKTLAYLIVPLVAVFAGCSTVDSRIAGHQADFNTWPPQIQEQVRHGQINIGFTREQVQVALGSPDHTFARTAANGSFEVWSYADRGPRFSFGIGMASFGRHSATGIGVGTGTAEYPEERLRVIFDAYGRVSSIEEIRRG